MAQIESRSRFVTDRGFFSPVATDTDFIESGNGCFGSHTSIGRLKGAKVVCCAFLLLYFLCVFLLLNCELINN